MKFRMLILAVAALAFASLGFGQGAAFQFSWNNQESASWYGLDYCAEGDGAGVVLKDGTPVRLMVDGDQSTFTQGAPYTAFDQMATIGTVGSAGQVTINEWTFNSASIPREEGSFLSPVIQYQGGVPAFQILYMVAGCYDGETFVPMWASQPWNIGAGPSLNFINCPLGGSFMKDCWTRVGCCLPPGPDCTPTPSPFVIDKTPGGHGDIDDPDPNEYYCLDLCVGFDLELQIGPLNPDELPIVNVYPGCARGVEGCNEECAPAVFGYSQSAWYYDEVDHMFKNMITVTEEGCACLELEDILPVELMSFDARALDREVELTWSTGVEVNVDGFEVVRDGETVHFADATGAGTYSWMDSDLNNGRTYSYELVSVSLGGAREVVSTTEATPMANLAVITEYALHQNFPNPFNPTTSIVFDVVEDNHVTLTVYNAMGQEVATLVNGIYTNGRHNVEFSSDNLTSGLYFYTVKIGNEFTATKKMLLVK